MGTTINEKMDLIGTAYEQYYHCVSVFISTRINNNMELAEDMTQDVFVRLMDYKGLLLKETIKSFIYTIANNLLIDYFRRNSKRMEIHSYIYDRTDSIDNTVFEDINVNNILRIEKNMVDTLPKMRRKIYCMSRYDGLSCSEIAEQLNMSQRTVESHLLTGRKEVRQYMSKVCI